MAFTLTHNNNVHTLKLGESTNHPDPVSSFLPKRAFRPFHCTMLFSTETCSLIISRGERAKASVMLHAQVLLSFQRHAQQEAYVREASHPILCSPPNTHSLPADASFSLLISNHHVRSVISISWESIPKVGFLCQSEACYQATG